MAAEKPPVTAELIWSEDHKFGATSGGNALVVDGDSAAGPSPVNLLAIALVSCMSIDIVDILRKGRHPISGFRSSLRGTRADTPPRRLLTVALHFVVHGEVPREAAERAMALSRDRYCSVWHSLREDIDLAMTLDIVP